MHECLTTLKAVARSTEELLSNQYCSLNSIEIKQTAEKLRFSIQPCMDELVQPAIQLRTNLKSFLVALDEAEDIWQSKQRVAEAPSVTIWEDIGEISGCWNRILQLSDELSANLVEQARQNWIDRIEKLRRIIFFDEKTNHYRSWVAGIQGKDKFNRELSLIIRSSSNHFNNLIKAVLRQLLQELTANPLHEIPALIDLLDQKSKVELTAETLLLLQKLSDMVNQLPDQLSYIYSNLSLSFHSTVGEWNTRTGDISWEEVTKFRDEALAKIDTWIELVINDRLVMIDKVVKWELAFYNDFSDKQKRYQQETLEQRLAEKAWIDQQRQHLEHLLANLEKSLEFSECFGNSQKTNPQLCS